MEKIDFRGKAPSRRGDAPVGKKYHEYKSLLREDFHERCGYCGDHEFFRETYYEIDHFVPKKIAPERKDDYSNLVYSCRTCNNSKRAKWPTTDPKVHNDGTKGWIDPCDAAYAEQFERLDDGSIAANTTLGKWMWRALTLGNPSHRLKWILEQIRVVLSKADELEDIADQEELRLINALNARYRNFEEQLRGVPNF